MPPTLATALEFNPARLQARGSRLLPILGLLGSPLVLFAAVIAGRTSHLGHDRVVGLLGLLYLAGWACSLLQMNRSGVFGVSRGARLALTVEGALLALAMLFSMQEVVYGDWSRMPAPLLDLAWPLSHTWMLACGWFVARAGRWRGWVRWVPLLVGLKIPMLALLSVAGSPGAQIIPVTWSAVLLATMAAVQLSRGAAHDPAVVSHR